MPKIIDILWNHNLERTILAQAYKKATGKSLAARATQIKDDEWTLVQPLLASVGSMTGKEQDSVSDDAKVFKAEEVSFGDDFLSGLGFAPKLEEEIENDIEKDDTDISIAPQTIDIVEEKEASSFGNARVISSAPDGTPLSHGYGNNKHGGNKRHKSLSTATKDTNTPAEKKESESKGKTFYKFSSNAPTFSKGIVKPQQWTPWKHGKDNKSQHTGKPHDTTHHNSRNDSKTPSSFIKKEIKEAATSDTLIRKVEIVIGDSISVKEFSEKMWVAFPELMKKFMANKILVNINSTIDFDTAALIGEEFSVKVKRQAGTISVDDMMSGNLSAILEIDKDAEVTVKRPPVVTIMGHVDHGKTKLLDYLRKTNVVNGEVGWITQSIGASQVIHNNEGITFIDTPWHQLFTSLRARGAKITNIVIIVIASDDGIKQQTVEAINHAKNAWVPIIVAVTKIDKGINNIESIKTQMAEHGLTPEDWGGDVPVMPVSAMTGQGIDDLLEQIVLQAEMLELVYNPKRNAVWVVLEATKDIKQGILTTLLVMTGTLKVWDIVMIHNTYGKVRKMLDRTGKEVKAATGWDPVMILGMQAVPEPGRVAEVTDTERQAQQKIAIVLGKENAQKDASWLQTMISQIASGDVTNLNVIVKADSFGSLEAAKYALQTMEMPENINVKIIHSDIGTFWESDLALAQAANAMVFWFNVWIPASIAKKANQLKINIKTYEIIYEMIDYIDLVLKWMVVIEAKEVFLGRLNVLAIFYKKEKEMIIGGKVIEGEIRNWAELKIRRKWESGEDEIIGQGRITSLKRDQENVSKVAVWYECGMKVRVSKKVIEGDVLEFFVME